jgi:hypothetical protein
MGTLSQRTAPASALTQVDSPARISDLDVARRRFLRAFGVGGAGMAVAATQALAAPVVATSGPPLDARGAGYRETEHVRDYYASTRL